MRIYLFLILTLYSGAASAQAVSQKTQAPWWNDAAFGVMFHFGLYSVPAGQMDDKAVNGPSELFMKVANISSQEYAKFGEQFSPQSFSAREWVNLAKSAGAKYVMITAKHRDGFCMWDSKVTSYDVVDGSAYKRDVVAQLAKAAQDAGLKFGVYYSIEDWHYHEQNRNNLPQFIEEYLQPQLRELVEQNNLDLVLLDRGNVPNWDNEHSAELYSFLHKVKPSLLIGVVRDDAVRPENGVDYFSIANPNALQKDQELRTSMSDDWGFRHDDTSWKPTSELVETLIDANLAGSNFLLNIGPKPFGTMASESLFRLKEIGEWMKQNGEAVYTTQLHETSDSSESIRFTRSKDGKWIYVFLMESKIKTFKLTELKLRRGVKPIILGTTKPVGINENRIGFTFTLPDGYSYDYACVVKIPVTP